MLADWDTIAGQTRKKQECKGYLSYGSMEFTFFGLVEIIFLAQRVPRGNHSLNEAYKIELIEWGEHEYIYMLHSTAEIAQLPCCTVRRQQIGFIVCLTLPMQGAS